MMGKDMTFSTCFHGRAWLSAKFLEHTTPLGRVVAACSNGDAENIALCERYGVEHVVVENKPLGLKHEAAMDLARKYGGPVMVLPSDDFVNPAYVSAALASGADYVFPASCGFLEHATGKSCVMRWDGGNGLLYGAGRVLSGKVLDMVPRIWTPTRNRGLDQDSHCTILAAGFVPVAVDCAGVCLTDVKTGENLWGYGQVAGRASAVPAEVVTSHFRLHV
jgi:hypothetical protein